MSGKKKHMDVFLREIFKRYIAIQDVDYKKSQSIFNSVFDQVKQKMCEQDKYFDRYANEVLNAGSVYDGIKVGRLDEFDLDIVIRLPISYDDIIIEPHKPGLVKLKITSAFDNLDKQKDWEVYHKVTRDWRDEDKFFLQNRFRQWMQRVVQRAVNELNGKVTVGELTYLLTFKEAGPAFTLNIRNESFSLDVDLVPCIRFMLPRWPEGYRSVEGSQEKKWLVVPKPVKSEDDQTLRSRCWRLAFHDYEREIIKGCELLKLTIRMVKKLRDSLNMKEIASYYIKTLFLWEIEERQDKTYWQNKVSVLFTDMVTKLLAAIEAHNIPYYWHKHHNLIAGLKPTLRATYCDKLKNFLTRLEANDVDSVVTYLLTPDELKDFRSSDFYKSFPIKSTVDVAPAIVQESRSSIERQESKSSVDSSDSFNLRDMLNDILASHKRLESKLDSLTKRIENKVDCVSKRVDQLYAVIDDVRKEIGNKSSEIDKEAGSEFKNLLDKDAVSGEAILNGISDGIQCLEIQSGALIDI